MHLTFDGSCQGLDQPVRRVVLGLLASRWNIGFLDVTDMKPVIAGSGPRVRWLQHSHPDRWFADPFILNANASTIELLVEEWVDELQRGRISKLLVDRRTMALQRIVPLFDPGYHLSFPAVYEREDEVFVQPESCANGDNRMYRYDRQNEKLCETGLVMTKPLADAVILPEPVAGKYFMFSTRLSDPSGTKLDVYISTRWDAGYVKHSEVHFPDRVARNAGAFFKYDGQWVRSAQDCNRRYGHGLVFQQLRYDQGRFAFNELGRRYPDSRQWPLGIHTFNVCDGLAVVDGHARRSPYVGAALAALRVDKMLAGLRRRARNSR